MCTHMHARRLYRKLSLEVMLSVAFGIALDIQNGKGGKIYKAVGDMSDLSDGGMDLMMILFSTSETNSHFMEVTEYLAPLHAHHACKHVHTNASAHIRCSFQHLKYVVMYYVKGVQPCTDIRCIDLFAAFNK